MKMLWLGIYLAACFAAQAHGQEHDFSWAMQCEDMRGLIFSFFAEEDWKTHNQIRQVNQHMRDLFRRETGIADERWQELETLQDHFGRLRRPGGYNPGWFQSSDPGRWENNWRDQNGKLHLSVTVFEAHELQSSTPVTHALTNVVALNLNFRHMRSRYPQLDLDYIARLFPNLEELTIYFDGQVESVANLESLDKMPLKSLSFKWMNLNLPLAEWLPDMTQLEILHLGGLALDEGQTELDLRHLIPPSLERFSMSLAKDQPVRVLFKENLVLSPNQDEFHVINFYWRDSEKESAFSEVERFFLDV